MTKADIAERVNTITPAEYIRATRELIQSEREIAEATEVLAAARGVRSGIFKRAKKLGADIDAMKHLAKLAAMDDDDRNRLMENVDKYAGWTGVQLWRAGSADDPQGTLLDPEAVKEAEGLIDARITADGYNSRRHGGPRDDGGAGVNPYEAGTRAHQTWALAWGDADRDADNKPAPVKASAARRPLTVITPNGDTPVQEEPKRRGRPPGSGKKPDAPATIN